jgi:hypothetical protein
MVGKGCLQVLGRKTCLFRVQMKERGFLRLWYVFKRIKGVTSQKIAIYYLLFPHLEVGLERIQFWIRA